MPPTSGTSGSSGTPTNCHPCDGTYTCTVTGSSTPEQFSLSKSGQDCQINGAQPAILKCDGNVTQGGTNVGTWTRSGSVTTVKQGTNGFTCMPDNPRSPGNDPMCLDANGME